MDGNLLVLLDVQLSLRDGLRNNRVNIQLKLANKVIGNRSFPNSSYSKYLWYNILLEIAILLVLSIGFFLRGGSTDITH